MSIKGYFLGCPIWSRKDWVGELFPTGARAADLLTHYAAIFNSVEGNTTFYAVPSPAAVARWCEQTPEEFSFCFKFPKTITHESRLRDCRDAARAFLDRLAPLGSRLGPTFVQLSPTFGPEQLAALQGFLDELPGVAKDRGATGRYAVEVRHPAFYADTVARRDLDGFLRARGIDRVILDSRGLHSAWPETASIREAQRKKPKVPLHAVVTGDRPFVRFIGHPEIEANRALLPPWADRVAQWIAEGRTPHVFMHMPDDFYAPRLARMFHDELSRRRDVGELPSWPIEPPARTTQLDLF